MNRAGGQALRLFLACVENGRAIKVTLDSILGFDPASVRIIADALGVSFDAVFPYFRAIESEYVAAMRSKK